MSVWRFPEVDSAIDTPVVVATWVQQQDRSSFGFAYHGTNMRLVRCGVAKHGGQRLKAMLQMAGLTEALLATGSIEITVRFGRTTHHT
jgi:hypothetical protein